VGPSVLWSQVRCLPRVDDPSVTTRLTDFPSGSFLFR